MVPSFFLSVLQRQRALLGEQFRERYPHDWLVWEPGPWRPTSHPVRRDLMTTQHPQQAGSARPAGEEAICFVVAGPTVKLGRASTCDLVLDDITVSREAAVLQKTDGGWQLDLGEGPAPLPPDGRVQLGAITLTVMSAEQFLSRLDAGLRR